MQNSAPPALQAILDATAALNFTMASDRETGLFLRTLAASKPDGRLLELGTGTGISTCWLLDGMGSKAHLTTMDNDPEAQGIAQRDLGHDERVTFHCEDGEAFLMDLVANGEQFDLIFADTWHGKILLLDEALSLVKSGGIYVVDDLNPQPNWTPDHSPKVEKFIKAMYGRDDFWVTQLDWSTGLMIAVRK